MDNEKVYNMFKVYGMINDMTAEEARASLTSTNEFGEEEIDIYTLWESL
jgi:hypothetical protein